MGEKTIAIDKHMITNLSSRFPTKVGKNRNRKTSKLHKPCFSISTYQECM
jgi:hypothetical protein